MRKNKLEIESIKESFYEIYDAMNKFDVCVPTDLRSKADREIASEIYSLCQKLNRAVVQLASKPE